MANDCIPLYEDADRLTGHATEPIVGSRFVAPTAPPLSGPGIPATAQIGASDPVDGANISVGHVPGAKPLGVSTWDCPEGKKVGVICEGVVPITAGENLKAGDMVGAGELGKAVKLATEGSDALLETGVTANNNAIVFRAQAAGVAGATVKIKIVVAGNNTPFSIVVAGKLITINLATGAGGAATTTAKEVIEKVNANAEAFALLSASEGAGSSGVGVPVAVAESALVGGAVATERGGLCVIGAAANEQAYIKLHC